MKVLLDTHIALWYLNGDEKLPERARMIIDDWHNVVYVSSVSIWEIEIKHIIHPCQMQSSGADVASKCLRAEFVELPLRNKHIQHLSNLKRKDGCPSHKDPFDKILISQAKSENMMFLTHDSLLADYEESCVMMV